MDPRDVCAASPPLLPPACAFCTCSRHCSADVQVSALDADKDGRIDTNEVLAAFDTDRSGGLSGGELTKLASYLSAQVRPARHHSRVVGDCSVRSIRCM